MSPLDQKASLRPGPDEIDLAHTAAILGVTRQAVTWWDYRLCPRVVLLPGGTRHRRFYRRDAVEAFALERSARP